MTISPGKRSGDKTGDSSCGKDGKRCLSIKRPSYTFETFQTSTLEISFCQRKNYRILNKLIIKILNTDWSFWNYICGYTGHHFLNTIILCNWTSDQCYERMVAFDTAIFSSEYKSIRFLLIILIWFFYWLVIGLKILHQTEYKSLWRLKVCFPLKSFEREANMPKVDINFLTGTHFQGANKTDFVFQYLTPFELFAPSRRINFSTRQCALNVIVQSGQETRKFYQKVAIRGNKQKNLKTRD